MRKSIYEMDDLKDSKEFFKLKPNRIISIFIIFIMISLLGIFIWLYFGEIDKYFKVSGVLKPKENIILVKNIISGKVKNKEYFAGKQVNKNDKLFSIDEKDIQQEKQRIFSEQEQNKKQKNNLLNLKKSIQENKNYFDKNNKDEQTYYEKYLLYKKMLEMKNREINGDKFQILNLNRSKNELLILKKSIQRETNYIKDSNSTSYFEYKDFELDLNKLKNLLQEKKKSYNLKIEQNNAEVNMEELKKEIQNIELEMQKIKNKYLLNVQSQIENISQNINNLESLSKKKAKDTMSNYSIDTCKLEYIIKIEESIKNLEKDIEKNNSILKKINLGEVNYNICAPISGCIDVIRDVNKGDLIENGTEILKIIPNTNKYTLQVFIPNKNILQIKKDQNVKISFIGISNNEYKNIEGKIVYVSNDAMINATNNISYYTAEINIKKIECNKKPIKLKPGMQTEVKIITGSKNLLKSILEKLDLFN